MEKKHLEYVAKSDDVGMEGVIDKLRDYGATPDMLDYIADTVRGLRDRYGHMKLGGAVGLDREAALTHSETKETSVGPLLVFHMDVSREASPQTVETTVVIGFMLDENDKITQLVNMG